MFFLITFCLQLPNIITLPPAFGRPNCVEEGDKLLFAMDSTDSRLYGLDPGGKIHHQGGGRGNGPGEFQRPSGLTCRNGKVYVVDANGQKLVVFDQQLRYQQQFFLGIFASTITCNDQFLYVQVTDTVKNTMVTRFTHDLKPLNSFGTPVKGPSLAFLQPAYIQLYKNLVLMVNSLQPYVYQFSPEGKLLDRIDLPGYKESDFARELHEPNPDIMKRTHSMLVGNQLLVKVTDYEGNEKPKVYGLDLETGKWTLSKKRLPFAILGGKPYRLNEGESSWELIEMTASE